MIKILIAVIAIMSVILGISITRLISIEGEVRSLSDQVVLQTGAINRGLKNIVPLVLPQGIEEEINVIESQLKDEAKWPNTPAEIQRLTDRLANVVNKLPPWAQEELLPRLVPRRWDTEALWISAQDPKSDVESLSNYASSIQSHLSTKPTDSSNEIEKFLELKLQKAMLEIPKAEQVAAISVAKNALETKQDMESALRALVVYEGDEAKALSRKLNDSILVKAFNQEVGVLETDLDRYEKLVDVNLRDYAIVRANQLVMELRLRVHSSAITADQLDARLNSLEKRVGKYIKDASTARQSRDAERLKQYQVWALAEMKKIRSFKSIEDIEISKISSKLNQNNPMSAERQNANAMARRVMIDELVAHMAPINQALLEPAVSQWFGKVYQRQYSVLSLDEDQLELIKLFATAHKRTLEELP